MKKTITKLLLCTGLTTGMLSAQTVTLNPNTTYQTITGWEATAQAWALLESSGTGQPNANPLFAGFKNELFDLLVDTLGINRMRVEVYSGSENSTDYFTQYLNGTIAWNAYKASWYNIINDNNDPNVANASGFNFSYLDFQMDNYFLPLKQRVEAAGEKAVFNLCYVDFGTSSFEHYSDPNEYAELITECYKHLQTKYGFTPDLLEIGLEPDNTPWTGTQMGNSINACITKLEAAGFTPKFVAPSVTNINNALTFFNAIATQVGSTNVSKYIEELSYHLYGGADINTRGAMATKAAQYGINTSQLEFGGANYHDLHNDLSQANNSSWAQYTAAYNLNGWNVDDGYKYFMIDDVTNPSNPPIVTAAQTKYFRQYMRYVRPGAVRIDAASSTGNVESMAFINADGNYIVIAKTYANQSITVNGLPAGTYGISYTTSGSYHAKKADKTVTANGSLSTSIPGAGVLTIFGKNAVATNTATTPVKNSFPAQVFPNPFSNGTQIRYLLKEESNITLELVNSLGEVVKTYESNSVQPAGEYVYEISSLAAGMYHLRLVKNNEHFLYKVISAN